MRIATYNVEWFASLFDDAGHLLEDDDWSARRDVTRRDQLNALGAVFGALDADAVMVVEAPDSHARRDGVAALRNFAAHFGLRAREAVMGYVNQTQQEIALLYDPDALEVRHDPLDLGAPRFDKQLRIDLDIDSAPETVRFSKPPLELAVTTRAGNRLRLIGVHVKSKAPHGARSAAEILRISIANRRKQLAQCIWLRRRVEAQLARGDSLIVLGDFNDGPGLDEYEKLFGRSGVEIVLGIGEELQLHDPHAAAILSRPTLARPSSARFRVPPDGRFLAAMLDYVMVSPDLAARYPAWRIWHPFEDPALFADPDLRHALLTASDHFPVSLDLDA
ncbi:possible Endonuclease/Exonuclease/phosphatase fa [Oceanicola granulosus HTCC2516]|uniref:Possible Endonuclease/Exonuclease/phosphatase fa n=1 Tax=Oceanicola granulosus (strain ATCC BAA-861 / DSM 15982 / KCTC 12143 / HTCC2516) TaxID=314256 RepID=Q2CAJ6_OCEGH|nr:endonuclease/exonuclease/phosphatase family protein [Oceanicola granulosus]EAR49678.1 possible Endonuclease/Exonuclease/phosphatase fa [Oceanicola granulosus HTCC2516]